MARSDWDVFFSYRRKDFDQAAPLLSALEGAGLRIWRDKTDIPDQSSITQEIRNGIGDSKLFLAFYSRTYPLSNPCQQEITAAWLAAQQIENDPRRRVWIVNPEIDFEHMPAMLRDQQVSPDDRRIAEGIKSRVDELEETLGRGFRELPAFHGMAPIQARRFVGRVDALWNLHGKLTANQLSIITGVYGQSVAQVRGLGGNGKSLLAREYAIRFGPAYPGGVFCLNAYGNDDTKGPATSEQRESNRRIQIREFATQLGVPTDLDPKKVEAALWRAVDDRGERCLWIVDDIPFELAPEELQQSWVAGSAKASTLITTRSKEYGALGDPLDLGVLQPGEAFDLLSSHRKPVGVDQEGATREIAGLLGYHPLAVEVAGSYLAQGLDTFESYRDALLDPSQDAVEFGKELKDCLPTRHERSISATLLRSIRQLGPEGLDFLKLSSVLAVAPIEVSFVSEVYRLLENRPLKAFFTALFNLRKVDVKSRALRAVNHAKALSLCESSSADAITIHTLVSRTMHFQFHNDERARQIRGAAMEALASRIEQVRHIGKHFKIAGDLPHARHLIIGDENLWTPGEAALAILLAKRDFERADYGSAQKLEEQVLATCRRLVGGNHRTTLTAMNNLALTLQAQGDLASARGLQKQVLATSRRLLGEEHADTLRAINNLASTLEKEDDFAGARELQEQVLATYRRLLGEQHPNTLMAINNLALTLRGEGDLIGAQELQEQTVVVARRVLGEEHPDTLTIMHNFALTLKAQGDLIRARELEEQVVAAMRRVLGEAHPNTLMAMENLTQMK